MEYYLLFLLVFHEVVEVAQQVMEDVKHELKRPLLPVLDHRCDKSISVLKNVQDFEIFNSKFIQLNEFFH